MIREMISWDPSWEFLGDHHERHSGELRGMSLANRDIQHEN